MGEIGLEKEGKSKQINRFPYLFWSLVVVSLVLFLLAFSYSLKEQEENLICGDGTFLGDCSLNKPYYCLQGELIMNASLCGCPKIMKKVGGQCVLNSSFEAKQISFDYILDGEINQIELTIYPEVASYLGTLPRTLIYDNGEIPRRDDFKLLKINDELQREALIPLVVAIQNIAPGSVETQAKIVVSLVQNINYGEPEIQKIFGQDLRLSRFPYQVLEEEMGSCEGKSELMAFLLREIGYGVSLFYYNSETHEAVGIKCPSKYSFNNTGYCFVETTVPAPISYSTGSYLGIQGGRLHSSPEIVILNKGISLEENIEDYVDAKKLSRVLDKNGKTGTLNIFQRKILNKLREKYGLTY